MSKNGILFLLNNVLCDDKLFLKKRGVEVKGTVKWFNNEKGYGFIESNNLADIFVHYSVIKKDGYKTLSEGDNVTFKLIETPKGLQAQDVETLKLTTV
jgi:CspA family cold shock protein